MPLWFEPELLAAPAPARPITLIGIFGTSIRGPLPYELAAAYPAAASYLILTSCLRF